MRLNLQATKDGLGVTEHKQLAIRTNQQNAVLGTSIFYFEFGLEYCQTAARNNVPRRPRISLPRSYVVQVIQELYQFWTFGRSRSNLADLCRDRSAFDRNPLKLWALMANKSTLSPYKIR